MPQLLTPYFGPGGRQVLSLVIITASCHRLFVSAGVESQLPRLTHFYINLTPLAIEHNSQTPVELDYFCCMKFAMKL